MAIELSSLGQDLEELRQAESHSRYYFMVDAISILVSQKRGYDFLGLRVTMIEL
jgi:hypothetical protein